MTDSQFPTEVSSGRAERPAESPATGRSWLHALIQPVAFLVCGVLLFAGLGFMQSLGLISSGGGSAHGSATQGATQYICPMMCTPPQSEPGRCPVCAMELVPATSSGGKSDGKSVQIETAARRIANIQTTEVVSMPLLRSIRAVGRLRYDEGSMKTISAYVDGRLDKLFADYTGAVVRAGEPLALLYSPSLYSTQVEYLTAKKSTENVSTLASIVQANRTLFENSRQRLVELGMTEQQIQELATTGKANSRLNICSPMSGTVIEKFAIEGQYVREGEVIYQLADLSTVWLMLELFPEDAAGIRYGQKVSAEVQSRPGKTFEGRVAFVDPNVDPKTRTIGVRVVLPNDAGLLKIGDYAKAVLNIPVSTEHHGQIYDPELANKWISPRHPQIVASSPGQCRLCGVDLVPAADFGFTDQPTAQANAIVVPRGAILMAGAHSVVYVETDPGRFEIRQVVIGPQCGDSVAIESGVKAGEFVASRGNFLIDSQMQLAGNPSLIDPEKRGPVVESGPTEEVLAALAKLSPADRELAQLQQICPVTEMPLGSMGIPPKAMVGERVVFLCCEGCRGALTKTPDKYLPVLDRASGADDGPTAPELPPIGNVERVMQTSNLPPIGVPQRWDEGGASRHDAIIPFASGMPEVVR